LNHNYRDGCDTFISVCFLSNSMKSHHINFTFFSTFSNYITDGVDKIMFQNLSIGIPFMDLMIK